MKCSRAAVMLLFWVPFEAAGQQQAESIPSEHFARLVNGYQDRVPLWRLLEAGARRPSHDTGAVSRARLRGLLPELRVGARVRQGNDVLQVQSDDTGRLNLSTDEQITLELELRFSLGRLLYDPSEPRLRRRAEERAHRWQARRLRIIDLYFEWVHRSAERDLRGSVPLEAHNHINAVAARLNLFTHGAFFRMLRDPTP